MKQDEKSKITQITWITASGFIGSVIVFLLTIILVPTPDFSSDIPKIPQLMLTLGQISTALLIIGSVTYGIKLAEEKKTIHSIGFTLFSVTQGVMFILYLMAYNGEEKFEEAYRIFSASLFLFIPSMILIGIYSEFPFWLRMLGIIGSIPYIVENIIFRFEGKFTQTIMIIDGVGNVLLNITFLFWGIVLLRRLKKELEAIT